MEETAEGTTAETMEETVEGTMAETMAGTAEEMAEVMAVIDLHNNNPRANHLQVETTEATEDHLGQVAEVAGAANAVRAESHEKVPVT